MYVESPSAIIVKACLICSSFYACNNIQVLSCGCTYHQFCASLHLESKATHCVNPTCGKPISNDWIIIFGFQHKSLLLKRPKQEKDAILSAPQGAYKAQFHQTISFFPIFFA
jgi:hypothetical protein